MLQFANTLQNVRRCIHTESVQHTAIGSTSALQNKVQQVGILLTVSERNAARQSKERDRKRLSAALYWTLRTGVAFDLAGLLSFQRSAITTSDTVYAKAMQRAGHSRIARCRIAQIEVTAFQENNSDIQT